MREHSVEQTANLPIESLQRIRTELNLERWSIWQPSKSSQKELKVRTLEKTTALSDGSHLNSKVKVGFTDEGILTTEDRKIYYALIKIWEDKGRPAGNVALSLRHLAKVLNRKWGTNVIETLSQSLLRLRITPLVWENSYYNSKTGETEEILTAFNIISELKIHKRKNDGHVTKEAGYFRFNDYIFDNLFANYTKPLHLDTLLKFKTEIAQLLYNHVDLMLAKRTCYQRRSRALFKDLGLEGKTYRNPSDRKRRLEKPLKELQGVRLSTGILTEIILEQTRDNKDFKLIFKKSPDTAEKDNAPKQHKQPTLDPDAIELVRYFHQKLGRQLQHPRSKEVSQAATLIQNYDADKAQYIIDYALKEAQKTNFRMQTFGAILQYQEEAVVSYTHQQQQRELFEIRQQQLEEQSQQTVVGQGTLLLFTPSESKKPTPEEQLSQELAALDEATRVRVYEVAEQKIASHKDRMSEEVYKNTLNYALLQELRKIKPEDGG